MLLDSTITRNRAEEYGFDLWSEFVIPPYYQQLMLLKSEKPQIIEGGRGSGKTMLIRYLCHETQFSSQRKNIPAETYRRIGIYWKMDISFASIMALRGATEDLWISAFENMAVLVLSSEVIRSLLNICKVNHEAVASIEAIDFSELKDFDAEFPNEFQDVSRYLRRRYNQFQTWVSNIRKIEQPLFYPKLFLDVLIRIIRDSVPLLKDTFYSVYLDEYENLNPTQKKIVNTWVKQSQSPIIFNIAMKHQSFDIADTLSDERIVEIHDYRKIDLEDLLSSQFATFASEIFLLKVDRHLFKVLDNDDYLYDTSDNALEYRTSKEYTDLIKGLIEKIFPKLSEKEVASIILKEDRLRSRLHSMLEKDFQALQNPDAYDELLKLDVAPEVLLVLHALLNRVNADVYQLFEEIIKYKHGDKSKFTEWIHNNLFGCILNFYGGLNRLCPLYTGYDTFLTMSKDNIRHFLELCYTSLSQCEDISQLQTVNADYQMLAVKTVSKNMLSEIVKFGPKGKILYLFSMRLGHLFEELRKRDSQSEPEQNQFSVSGPITDRCQALLNDLVKWSVLYEGKLTKQKTLESGIEYLFNPIYSAYFTISYRKKRRVELTSDEIMGLCNESDELYKKLIKRMTSRNTSQGSKENYQRSLFDIE